MVKKVDKKLLLLLTACVDGLLEELFLLSAKNFPFENSDLFYKKCMHFKQVLGVPGPVVHFQENLFGMQAVNESAKTVQENFVEFQNWLLGLKYRFILMNHVFPKKLSKLKKSLQFQIPSILKIGVEEK